MKKTFCILIPMMLLFGCKPATQKPTATTINVSILPQKYFIDRLLGDQYQVNVMVKAGYDPETYEPTPQQMQQLESASIYYMICEGGLDNVWTEKLKSLNPQMTIVDLSKNIDLIAGEDGHQCQVHSGLDPHTWVSPSTVLSMIEVLKESLITHFKSDSAAIEASYKTLKADVKRLDSLYTTELAPYENEKFMVYHPVLSYIARDYKLQQVAMEIEGKEPSVQTLTTLIDEAKSSGIKVIFVQQEFDTKKAALIATETGAKVITINPLNYDWMQETEQLLNHLVSSFK